MTDYEARRRDDQLRAEAMMHYAQSPVCRMQQLHVYFGQEADEPCGQCDNCQCAVGGAKTEPTLPRNPADSERLERLVASAVGNVPAEDVVG